MQSPPGMRHSLRSSLCLAGTLLLAIAVPACGDDDESSFADDAINEGETRGEDLAAETEIELGNDVDEVILGKSGAIMIAIDEGEILHAQFILEVGTDPLVLEFAEQMLLDHSAHAALTESLLADFDLAPIDNAVAAALRNAAVADLDLLERSASPDFDYMRMQLMMHTQALVIVELLTDLAPEDDAELFFAQTELIIEEHRDEAEDILRQFE
jgi:predicted outer membrane protein